MSGHSKWSKIHRQKEVTDAKRGQLFTKLGRAIAVAVRAGGGVTDPEANFQLRLAIEKAKQFNMPKVNIERALQRGAGRGEEGALEEVTYEGFGPEGIAVLAQATTDNKQRTSQEVRNLFEKGGGSLGGPGAVAYQFESMGLLVIEKPKNPEEALLKLIDLGADDVEEGDDEIEIYVKPENLEEMKQELQKQGLKLKSYELSMKPKNLLPVKEKQKAVKVLNFMDKLQDHDDVQKVSANFLILIFLMKFLQKSSRD
jgi:YebC/PmpR family DNA-binding regulatory protein